MAHAYHPYYLTGPKGTFRFTETGLKELGPYLAKAGIDIRTIKTREQYFKARRIASPYFMEWLQERASGWPETEEFMLLKQVLSLGSTS